MIHRSWKTLSLDERETLSLLDAFLKASPNACNATATATAARGVVDIFGRAERQLDVNMGPTCGAGAALRRPERAVRPPTTQLQARLGKIDQKVSRVRVQLRG